MSEMSNETGSQASDGASNESTKQEQTEDKKSKRRVRASLPSQVATLESESAGNSDAAVVQDLARVKSAFTGYEAATVSSPQAKASVPINSDGRAALRQVVAVRVDAFCACIRGSPGGRALVKASRSRNAPKSARKLQQAITPLVLGPFQPLLDAMNQALADFEAADVHWTDSVDESSKSTASAQFATRTLELSIQCLRASLKRAQALAALADLQVPTSASTGSKPVAA